MKDLEEGGHGGLPSEVSVNAPDLAHHPQPFQ
jgi:hypothetical protein